MAELALKKLLNINQPTSTLSWMGNEYQQWTGQCCLTEKVTVGLVLYWQCTTDFCNIFVCSVVSDHKISPSAMLCEVWYLFLFSPSAIGEQVMRSIDWIDEIFLHRYSSSETSPASWHGSSNSTTTIDGCWRTSSTFATSITASC